MDFKPILKKALNGGMVVSMMCMTFTPLSKMQIAPTFDVYAAVREIHQFQQVKQYNNNFADVGTSDWFYNSVAEAYKYDLVNGKSATKFDPKGNVTIAEVITMADKLHSYSTFGNLSPSIQMEAEPWYTLFVRYAETMQIISTGEFSGEYDRPATREELAHIFAHAIPDNGYQQINVVTTLPDIDSSNKYYNDVIKLYNAGIISGNDYRGTFTPKANITRAEAAAIASRLALPSTRIQLTFCKSIALPSEDNSFGELKKIGTQVISREERDRQRAEEQKQKEKEEKEQQEQAQKEKEEKEQREKEKEKEKEQSSNSRYNYNYTWDYETNSPVDPDEVRRLQREHGYNNTTSDDRDDRESSNKSSSKEDRNDRDSSDKSSSNKTSNKYETDSRGYLTFEGYIASQEYTQSDIDRIERNADGIRAEYNEYLDFMETVTSNFPKGKSSYSCFGKTYSDYYDFLYEISIRYGKTDGAWEYNGKIYFGYDEYTDAMSDKMHKEEQWEIEHYAEGTLELVNEARAEEGLPALTLDPDLVEVAEIRAKELCEYYSHTRPNGEAGITAIREYGCDYFYRAENIAKGTSNAIEIKTWLSSSGHRKQILSENYQYYGAATIRSESGTTYAIQVFGGLANP